MRPINTSIVPDITQNSQLLERLGESGSYYTSYPTHGTWSQKLDTSEYVASLKAFLLKNPDAPVHIYVHSPFCVKLCYYCNRELTLREIFDCGAGFCASSSEYEAKGIQLIENTPEEIRDLAVEMVERLSGTWRPQEVDEDLQCKFWEVFPTDAKTADGQPLHGEIRSRFGADSLRNNQDWLQ